MILAIGAMERRIRIGYNDARYELPALQWTQSSFIQPQMMVQDRYFYDPVAHKYTVDRYLDDLDKRYGGIDAVLIWPTYPNMGIDDRNQHDMIRSMPGGIDGVRQMVEDFHRRGVSVLFPMMMWDQGTRDPGKPWPEAIAESHEGDRCRRHQRRHAGWRAAGLFAGRRTSRPSAGLRAGRQPVRRSPGLERDDVGAILVSVCPPGGQLQAGWSRGTWSTSQHRWDRDKTDDLQFAFFNGEGWESWENVWGIWNGITPRDGEATRRVATIERAVAPFLDQPGLGAVLSDALLWRVCQPLAARRSDGLDHRQSQ